MLLALLEMTDRRAERLCRDANIALILCKVATVCGPLSQLCCQLPLERGVFLPAPM